MSSVVKAAFLIAVNVICVVYINATGFKCGETAPAPTIFDAGDPPQPKDGGTIEGKVFHLIDAEQKPYFGFGIQARHITSGEVKAIGITDKAGYFSLQVPAGTYRIEPQEREYLRIAGNSEVDTLAVSVEDSKCVFRAFHITNNSSISGMLLDEDGKKIHPYSLQLITASLQLIAAGKNEGEPEFENLRPLLLPDGFRFERIPPGEYHLSFNYRKRPDEDEPYPTCFYPGTVDRAKATVIRIQEGTTLPPLVFKLPPKLHKVSLNGLVVWKDGRPAAGVEMHLIDVEADDVEVDLNTDFSRHRLAFSKDLITDENGYFSWEAFAERKYKIIVVAWGRRSDGNDHEIGEAETEEFVLGTNTPSFRIELRKVDPSRSMTRICN